MHFEETPMLSGAICVKHPGIGAKQFETTIYKVLLAGIDSIRTDPKRKDKLVTLAQRWTSTGLETSG